MTLTRILNGFLVSEDGESAYFATAAEAAAVMERAIAMSQEGNQWVYARFPSRLEQALAVRPSAAPAHPTGSTAISRAEGEK